MQENQTKTAVKPPGNYDWSEFTRRERGFLSTWCRDHQHTNGEPFNYKTVHMIINGNYCSGAGPKIKDIIEAALKEGLISEYSQAA